jgi:ribosomal protein S18 acetylase RimI-like enzyme
MKIMKVQIRSYQHEDLDSIIELSLLAWAPVFESFQAYFPPEIYFILHPDWRKNQAEVVRTICQDIATYTTLVAEEAGQVVGFVCYQIKPVELRGEVLLLAVHPNHQNRGTGTELNLSALQAFQDAGIKIAIVETGGDDGHAPARRAYEKAGYTPFPIVRYFKKIND